MNPQKVTNLRAVVELTLRRLSVMCVKIDDENAFNAKIVDSVFGRYCDVVAEAKAVKLRRHSMVTRRTNQGYAVGYLSCRQT